MSFMDQMLIDQQFSLTLVREDLPENRLGWQLDPGGPKGSVRQFSSAGLRSKSALHGRTKAASP